MNEYKLRPHQLFIKKIMNPNVRLTSDSFFLFHNTGSGKTCSAVQISEGYVKYLKARPKFMEEYIL